MSGLQNVQWIQARFWNVKVEKPKTPSGAPQGTVWSGGPIDWFRITLKICSDDLIPEEITKVFRVSPDESFQRGKPILRSDGSIKRMPKFGVWRVFIQPSDTDEWDCCEAAMELLARLPSNVEIWRNLSKKYEIIVSFALSLESSNKGFCLTNEFLKFIGERGISADFDIYHEDE